MTNKKEWLDQLSSIWDKATEEERETLRMFLHGIDGYQDGKYLAFIDSYFQPERRWLNDDTFEVKIPLHKGTENQLQMTHGGVTATLLDISMGSISHAALPEDQGVVTLEMKVNYIKPGKGTYLRCESKLISKSKRILIAEGTVYNDNEQIIAHGTGTFYAITIS